MAAAKAALLSGLKLCEPLICVGLKSVFQIPEGVIDAGVKWVKERFTDNSLALTKAVTTAHERAWQAVELALATDTFFSRATSLFRDGDLKAVQKQIREFVATADTGLDGAADGLRTKACNELLTLKKAGRFALNGVELTSLDLTRHASSAKITDDAHRAVQFIAADLEPDAPHLSQVLTLVPPGGGTPLLTAAFDYFLRRQIATNEELARDLTFDQLRLITLKQQAGFANLERVIEDRWETLTELLADAYVSLNAKADSTNAKLDEVLRVLHVGTDARQPLKVTVENEQQKRLVKDIFEQVRALPPELLTSDMLSRLGDILAAAGQFKEAAEEQKAAADAAKEEADRQAEANAAYKQFKAECETRKWDAALAALTRAVALDEKRFRPVPKHYTIDAVIGAGSFGVVLKCRDTTERDDNGGHLVVAVKTFRETDLDRKLDELFAEATVLKKLSHENVVGIHERGFADPDAQQRPFLAMEFVPGVTLEEHLAANGRLNADDFTDIFRQIAAGLHAAHTARRPVIHRDLKPANVMVRWDDDRGWRVKVIDFGLAVASAERATSQDVPPGCRTLRDRSRVGTMDYAPPEQTGKRGYPVGPHSDVYAFGRTALESLLGTTQPTPRQWKQLPSAVSEFLERCVEEEFTPAEPTVCRYHGFGPILDRLMRVPAPRTVQPAPSVVRKRQQEVSPDPGLAVEPQTTAGGPSVPVQPISKPRKQTKAEMQRTLFDTNHELGLEESSDFSAKRRDTPQSRPAGERFELELPGGLKMTFAWCPPGTFLMGSPLSEKERLEEELQHAGDFMRRALRQETEKERLEEELQHAVRLTRGFYCGVHPVTQAEWRVVMGTEPSGFDGTNLPVSSVSWEDTQAFCQKICELTGKPVRLPTEAEWEYAARGGTTTPFYWGGELNGTQANCNGNNPCGTNTGGPYLAATSPVGGYSKKYPHPWGLTDVHGNVCEWCADCYDAGFYARSPKDDPECRDGEQELRVLRGGSWFGFARECRAAYRGKMRLADRLFVCGFRVVFCLGKFPAVAPPTPPPISNDMPAVVAPPTPPNPVVAPTDRAVSRSAIPTATPVRKTGDRFELDLPVGLKMAFAWCPSGTFLMGSPKSEKGRAGDESQHEVRLTKGFFCGMYPVTQAEWKAIMGTFPSHILGTNLPVESVNWFSAHVYCRKVRELTGKEVRLPTEAEWEYAARGGTATPFYWGSELSDCPTRGGRGRKIAHENSILPE